MRLRRGEREFDGKKIAYVVPLLQACEPLHIMYAYDDSRVYAINSAYIPVAGPLWGDAELFTPNGVSFFHASGGLPSGLVADEVAPLFSLPTPAEVRARLGPRRTYLVALTLYSGPTSASPIVSQGTYWLSTNEDVLDWNASTFYNTPCTAFADFTDLRKLEPAELQVR